MSVPLNSLYPVKRKIQHSGVGNTNPDYASPHDGGCWFCHSKDQNNMVFDTEFDTWVHEDCIMHEIALYPEHEEAKHMTDLFQTRRSDKWEVRRYLVTPESQIPRNARILKFGCASDKVVLWAFVDKEEKEMIGVPFKLLDTNQEADFLELQKYIHVATVTESVVLGLNFVSHIFMPKYAAVILNYKG